MKNAPPKKWGRGLFFDRDFASFGQPCSCRSSLIGHLPFDWLTDTGRLSSRLLFKLAKACPRRLEGTKCFFGGVGAILPSRPPFSLWVIFYLLLLVCCSTPPRRRSPQKTIAEQLLYMGFAAMSECFSHIYSLVLGPCQTTVLICFIFCSLPSGQKN